MLLKLMEVHNAETRSSPRGVNKLILAQILKFKEKYDKNFIEINKQKLFSILFNDYLHSNQKY